jgi:hypothetical protein
VAVLAVVSTAITTTTERGGMVSAASFWIKNPIFGISAVTGFPLISLLTEEEEEG